jgi:Golgi SNAP receptor complex protein 1
LQDRFSQPFHGHMSAAASSSKFKVWDSCRSEARRLDTELERRLATLESLAHAATDASALARFDREAREAATTSERFGSVVASLAELAGQLRDENDTEAGNASRHTARFEEVAQDKRVALARLAADARRRHERAQLMSRVQNDIDSFNEHSDVRVATQEQEALQRTTHNVATILETQARAGEKLTLQRQMFNQIGDRTLQLADQIPFIRDVVGRIDSKRRREAVLLSILIGFLMFLVFLFW